jgi:hypothetical protein
MVACCFVSVILAFGECLEVTQGITPLKSSSRVRVAISVNGHSASHAKVEVCTNGRGSCLNAVAGDDGLATLPPLAYREYYSVVATLEDGASGSLFLQALDNDGAPTEFSIDLTKSARVLQNLLATADKLPIREQVEAFRGTLRDVSGAIVQGADIKIFHRGSEDKTAVRIIKSDNRGQFSAQLGEGVYVAFFSMPGFRTEVVPFEIVTQGKKEILVQLQPGRC